jgi:DNA-binding XRE family transcriptional regulator
MSLREHITQLRKKKGLLQADLGKAVGASRDIIGPYERDEVKPSTKVIIKIADSLEASLDFLVGKSNVEIDSKALRRLHDIQKLNDNDKATVLKMVVAFLCDRKATKAYTS